MVITQGSSKLNSEGSELGKLLNPSEGTQRALDNFTIWCSLVLGEDFAEFGRVWRGLAGPLATLAGQFLLVRNPRVL